MSDLPLISTGNPDLMNSPNTTHQKNTVSNDFFHPGLNGNTTHLENSSKYNNTSNSQNLPHLMTPYSLGHHSNLEDTLILQRLLNSGGPGNNMGVINDSAIKNNKNITDFNARPSSVFQWENISSDFLLSSPDLIRDVLQQSINNSNSQVKNTNHYNNNNNNNPHPTLNIPTSVSPVSNILNSLFKTPAKNTLGNSGRGTNSTFNMLNFNSSIKKLTPLKFVTDSTRKMDPLLLEMSEIKVESIPNPNTTSTINNANNNNNNNNNTIHHQPRPQSFIPVTSLTGETLNIPYNNGVIGFVNNGISNRSLISTSPSLSRPHHMKRRNTFEPVFDDKENIIISNSTIHGKDEGNIDIKSMKKNKKPLIKHKTTIKKRKLNNIINNDTTILPPVHQGTSNVLKPTMKSFVFKESSSIIHEETNSTTDEEDGDGFEDSVNSSQATIELNFSAKKTTPLLPNLSEMTLTTSTNSIESSDILGNVSPTPKYKKKSRNNLPKLHKSFSTTTSTTTTSTSNGNKMLSRSVSGDTNLSITGLPKMGSFSSNNTSNKCVAMSGSGKHFSKNGKKAGSSSMPSNFQNGSISVSKKKNNSHNINSSMNSFSSNTSQNKSFQIVFTDPNVFESVSENTTAVSNTSNTSFNNSLIYNKNASSTPASRGSSFSSFQFNNSNSVGGGMKRKKKTSTLKRANSDVCNFSSSSSNSLKKR